MYPDSRISTLVYSHLKNSTNRLDFFSELLQTHNIKRYVNVHPWLIHANVWQNPPQYCKLASNKKRKRYVKKDFLGDPVAKTWRSQYRPGFDPWRRKWQPTPVFLPGESQGWRSLVGCCLWGRIESDTTEVT